MKQAFKTERTQNQARELSPGEDGPHKGRTTVLPLNARLCLAWLHATTDRVEGSKVTLHPDSHWDCVGQSLCPERLLCLPSHTFSTWPFLSHLSSRSFTSFLRHSSRTVTSFSCVHRLCTSFYHSISKYCDLVCLTDSPVVSGSFLSYPWQRAQSLAHRSCPTKFTLYATYLSSALDSGINTTQRFTAPLFGL